MFKRDLVYWRGRIAVWLAHWVFGSVIFASCLAVNAVAAPSEGELRAAVIVAIIRFTSWPVMENAVLEVCLVGRPVSENILLSISGKQKVATRTLNVHVAKRGSDDCQVMVIGADVGDAEYEQLMAAATEKAILTVCDGCRRGQGEEAIIQLKLRQQKVIFEVNLVQARSSGVSLDAQLLELATVVRK
ncbi:MAG: YfiR family protein [Cellvibrionaceae bacterium]|nr:YfiR family protein [Cellvibrionaceae bacterium]